MRIEKETKRAEPILLSRETTLSRPEKQRSPQIFFLQNFFYHSHPDLYISYAKSSFNIRKNYEIFFRKIFQFF